MILMVTPAGRSDGLDESGLDGKILSGLQADLLPRIAVYETM
jgi:hypothetical protein